MHSAHITNTFDKERERIPLSLKAISNSLPEIAVKQRIHFEWCCHLCILMCKQTYFSVVECNYLAMERYQYILTQDRKVKLIETKHSEG